MLTLRPVAVIKSLMKRQYFWVAVVFIAGLAVWAFWRGSAEHPSRRADRVMGQASDAKDATGTVKRGSMARPGERPATLRGVESGGSGGSSREERQGVVARSLGGQGSPDVELIPGQDSQSTGAVEVDASSVGEPGRLAALKPQGKNGSPSGGTVDQVLAEPPPEVVFESGKDERFVTETQVELKNAGKISGEAGSISLWLKPDWQPDDQNDAVFVQLGEQGIRLAKNVNFLRFEFIDDQGIERGAGTPVDSWKPGEWHHVVGAWVQGRLQLYVDGQLVSQNQFDAAPTFEDDAKVYVGSKLPSGSPAPGEMGGVRVLNRPLSAEEVKQLADTTQRPQ